MESDRLGALQQLVDKYQCVIVLKGAYTLIGCPRGRISLCPFGTPGLATAGSGDVLAGVLGGLLAQGFSAWDAATCGVVWHAMTGEAYVSQNGERTLTAREICDWLPEVLTC